MKHSNDFIVGATALATVAALTLGVVWVQQSDIGQRQRHVTARFHDVGNARVGNAAVIRGVRAGKIDAIELAPGGWVHVRMTLDRAVRMPADPVVLLNESSLFGEWQATIAERSATPGDESVRQQIYDASGGGRVLPGAALPGIGKLTAVAGQIAGDVASVAGRVEVAFDEQAARELRGSIHNFADLSTILAGTVKTHASDLDVLSAKLQTAIGSLNQTAQTTQRMAARLDSSMETGRVHGIVEDIATSSAELRVATAQVRALTERFAVSQGHLESFVATSDSILRKVNSGQGSLGLMVNDPSLYLNSDSTMVQLRALLADIKANPRRYVNVKIF